MGGIQGINGLPPTPDRPNDTRDRVERPEGRTTDDVSLSSEAQGAVEGARVIQSAESEPEIRQDRVDQARLAIENGEHQLEDRLSEVARRLLRVL